MKYLLAVFAVAASQLSFAEGLVNTPTALHSPSFKAITWLFGHVIVGAILSATVTTATQLDVCPQLSDTVKVTLFAPILLQLKLLLLIVNLPPTLPLLISFGFKVPFPLPSKFNVKFLHFACGAG